MHKFYEFIIYQLLQKSFNLRICNDFIEIECNGKLYKEKQFDYDSSFTPEDVNKLLIISKNAFNNEPFGENIKGVPILKCWYLITHEYYFKNEIELDKHDRTSSNNLLEEFHVILKVPIVDILKNEFNKFFGFVLQGRQDIYLTSDYDILNIWDIWGFRDFVKIELKNLFRKQYKNFIHFFYSYLYSRKKIKRNGYLNDTMFIYSDKVNIHNVAFFISLPENKKYDGVINYNDKVLKIFFENLKKNDVVFALHTNYNTHDDPDNISSQLKAFTDIFATTPTYNRHHYLRFKFPEYLKTLQRIGIKCDFSLYFPESLLFRAGTCSKYKVWDKVTQTVFPTQIIPITLMDGTFTDYLKCSEQEAYNLAKSKLEFAKKYSDSIVLLWHNSSLNNYNNHLRSTYHATLYKKILMLITD